MSVAIALLTRDHRADTAAPSTTPDLVTWTLRPQPLLDHGDPAFGVETLYRSTGVVEHGTLVVWYAMQTRS